MNQSHWRKFWLIFLPAAVTIVVIAAIWARWAIGSEIRALRRSEESAVTLQIEAVRRALTEAAADACILARQNELHAYLVSDEPELLREVAREFLVLSETARVYDQIRYISESGLETVRVDFHGGHPAPVPDESLQDKSSRYYVKDALAVGEGEVYASPLDLNVEQGAVELPFKPMVRLATRVVTGSGGKRGIIVLNLLAQLMLDRIVEAGGVGIGDPMMLNADGYWFISPTPPPTWGFMLPGHEDDRMERWDPEAWSRVVAAERGQVRTTRGLLTFRTYRPLDEIRNCPGFASAPDPSSYRWILASHVPATALAQMERNQWLQAASVALLLLVIAAAASRSTSLLWIERRRHREHLESLARTDALTGLANRSALLERMNNEIRRARRYQRPFAVLFIDLDGFKAVNDSQGHEVGDLVLVDVAAVLTRSLRALDTPCRWGGDEFVVLLTEVPDEATAVEIATKLLRRIGALDWDGMRVGASIGVAAWPGDDETDASAMIDLADDAMYRAKTEGKNQIRTAGGP